MQSKLLKTNSIFTQESKNKLYIYTREKNTGIDRRFLMKRVEEGWKIDAVQERLDGWQRTGL